MIKVCRPICRTASDEILTQGMSFKIFDLISILWKYRYESKIFLWVKGWYNSSILRVAYLINIYILTCILSNLKKKEGSNSSPPETEYNRLQIIMSLYLQI